MPSQEKNWTRITVVWSSLAFMTVAAFWLVWHLVAGEIPALRELTMRPANEKSGVGAWIVPLPFAISRAWDAFLAPLFVLALGRLWRWAEKTKAVKRDNLILGLILGLFAGLIFGLGYGVIISIGFGAVIGWSFTLIIWTPFLAVWLAVLASRGIRDWFRSSSGSRVELKKLLSGQT